MVSPAAEPRRHPQAIGYCILRTHAITHLVPGQLHGADVPELDLGPPLERRRVDGRTRRPALAPLAAQEPLARVARDGGRRLRLVVVVVVGWWGVHKYVSSIERRVIKDFGSIVAASGCVCICRASDGLQHPNPVAPSQAVMHDRTDQSCPTYRTAQGHEQRPRLGLVDDADRVRPRRVGYGIGPFNTPTKQQHRRRQRQQQPG